MRYWILVYRRSTQAFEARLRTVTFKEYILRALKLSDGRFAQRSKFRYVVYNMWIRTQTHKRSTFYLKKDQREDITIEKLREMFNQDSEHSASNKDVIIEQLREMFNQDRRKQYLQRHCVGGTVFGVLVEHLPQLLNCDVLTLILLKVECANPHVVYNVAEPGMLDKPPIKKLESTQNVFLESYRAQASFKIVSCAVGVQRRKMPSPARVPSVRSHQSAYV
ncbi:hypothetical protein E4U56_003732 [Claviceps arundinis]|uniref:Uncharacterized protein n=1 Tax=Claviceps arundinis TaxID=1623583 RepID=A0A9P7MPD1_9HYPO|nr:hypothetical protein E4U56_003732 [Claviceps arundinis]